MGEQNQQENWNKLVCSLTFHSSENFPTCIDLPFHHHTNALHFLESSLNGSKLLKNPLQFCGHLYLGKNSASQQVGLLPVPGEHHDIALFYNRT